MQDRIPLPTDNIYKFYALFGLLLFIFSAGALIYVVRSNNELIYQLHPELAALQQMDKPTAADVAKKSDIEKRLVVAHQDSQFYYTALGVIAGVGITLMVCGFWKWHRDVQPIQDEMAKLQLEKLRHEVKQLKHSEHKSS